MRELQIKNLSSREDFSSLLAYWLQISLADNFVYAI